jgi:protoporphyrinogen oxidase
MDKKKEKVVIIGSGVSGLTASRVLEEAGFSPVILEAETRLGGRLKSDHVEGYILDHGFQVLLTEYPAVKKYLDLVSLDLITLLPGASIKTKMKTHLFGDPLRSFRFLLPVLFSPLANLKDKWLIYQLQRELRQDSLDVIFSKEEFKTKDYLKKKGFSVDIIESFFRPFYAGIFLEQELRTSSRMFEFVFKMFAEGSAAIPKNGMEAIPQQMFKNLKHTQLRLNSKVVNIEDNFVLLGDGTRIEADRVIIACEIPKNLKGLENLPIQWNSCHNFYFEVDKEVVSGRLIGLIRDTNSLINNIFYPTSIYGEVKKGKHLLSVTIVNDKGLLQEELVTAIIKELKMLFLFDYIRLIKSFHIKKALPKIDSLEYKVGKDQVAISESIFIAGDTRSNASLNAAILSGEFAAENVIKSL